MKTTKVHLGENMGKILVVEDSQFISNVLKFLLSSKGYEVKHTRDGEDILGIAKEFQPDAITLDLMMPAVTGEEVLGLLKADPATKHIPVMVVSAKVNAIDEEKELEQCDGFVSKPFDNDVLMKELLAMIAKSKK